MLLGIPGSQGLHDHGLEVLQRTKVGVLQVLAGVPIHDRQRRHVGLRERHAYRGGRLQLALLRRPLGYRRQALGIRREPLPARQAHPTSRAEQPQHGCLARRHVTLCLGRRRVATGTKNADIPGCPMQPINDRVKALHALPGLGLFGQLHLRTALLHLFDKGLPGVQ
ncbi:hypothetical protein D3C84_797860 [compost metagenome]